jgi:threonine synthase
VEWGITEILEDSSGNAGASVAAYAARAGIRANIYVPESTSAGKIAQIETYGAHLTRIPGSREDSALAAWNAADDIFYASHNWNPYFLAGMKTAAYEIAEQSMWQQPDWVVAPAGGGGLLVGLYLGFTDLVRAGIIRAMPRLAAIQSAGCDPIYYAWSRGLSDIHVREKRPTAAEGISVARPVRRKLILEAIRGTNGIVRTVSDDAVWETLNELGRCGVYVEPTSAAAPGAFAGLVRDGIIKKHERTVIMLTGSGLKATDKIVQHASALVAV